jgi:hypothetical protein
MTALIHQRCWNHSSREAVARCPICSRFYCRECVTEHLGRMICVTCVAATADKPAAVRNSSGIMWTGLATAGLLLAWIIFYYLGALLARIPSDFFDKPA